MDKNKIISTQIIRKEYSYQTGVVSLVFTLDQQKIKDLESFKSLLISAIKDVEKDIKDIKE